MNTHLCLGDIGEVNAIERLLPLLRPRNDIVLGPGDDCAVLRTSGTAPYDWLLTSDPIIAGIHFDTHAPPRCVGHKAIGRVLSDLAAMGGVPKWALLNVVAPAATPVATLMNIYHGATRLAHRYGLAIVGGDLTNGPRLEIHAFAVGQVQRGRAITRHGAKPGDAIFVTGSLGGSRLGKHLRFSPRVVEGQWLHGWASAMIDLSDGLASDLRHVTAASETGARLQLQAIPVAASAGKLNDGATPLEHALRDGEDFELLFTIPPNKVDAFKRAWRRAFRLRCSCIGIMTPDVGVIECVLPDGTHIALEGGGYEHFRSAGPARLNRSYA